MDEPKLSPTQELVMEVLAGRWREGRSVWTFSARHRRTLESLASLGLIHQKSGVVERTRLAWFSDKGLEAWGMNKDYAAPVPGDLWVRPDLKRPAKFHKDR